MTAVSYNMLEMTLVLQLLMVSTLLNYVVQSHTEEIKVCSNIHEHHGHRRRSGKLCKALLLVCILSVLMDSMSIGGLVVAKDYWSRLESLRYGLASTVTLMLVRIFLQLLVLILMAKRTK